MVRGLLWAPDMKGELIPLLLLPYPFLNQNRYLFSAGLTKFSSPKLTQPGFELMTFQRPAP